VLPLVGHGLVLPATGTRNTPRISKYRPKYAPGECQVKYAKYEPKYALLANPKPPESVMTRHSLCAAIWPRQTWHRRALAAIVAMADEGLYAAGSPRRAPCDDERLRDMPEGLDEVATSNYIKEKCNLNDEMWKHVLAIAKKGANTCWKCICCGEIYVGGPQKIRAHHTDKKGIKTCKHRGWRRALASARRRQPRTTAEDTDGGGDDDDNDYDDAVAQGGAAAPARTPAAPAARVGGGAAAARPMATLRSLSGAWPASRPVSNLALRIWPNAHVFGGVYGEIRIWANASISQIRISHPCFGASHRGRGRMG